MGDFFNTWLKDPPDPPPPPPSYPRVTVTPNGDVMIEWNVPFDEWSTAEYDHLYRYPTTLSPEDAELLLDRLAARVDCAFSIKDEADRAAARAREDADRLAARAAECSR